MFHVGNKGDQMIKFILFILFNQEATIFISLASLVSAVADKTGDDGIDAVVKIKRLANEIGPDFCMITNWKFMRDNITFNITNAGGYIYSGASYLPATFKNVIAARVQDQNSAWFPLYEKSISEADITWVSPDQFATGIPDEFVITRPENGYWEIMFNRKPGQTYTVYMEIEKQWVDMTDSVESVITKDYFTAFAHYVSMARFEQQGDLEAYNLALSRWWDPRMPRNSILGRILSSMGGGMVKKQIKMDERLIFPGSRIRSDYNKGAQGIGY